MRALICFHNHGAGPFAKYLERGFRHVFIAVLNEGYWIRIDGQGGLPVYEVVAGEDYDLQTFYRQQSGFTVKAVEADRAPLRWPFMQANCVGLVKRTLGINAPFVFTPYQLYRYLP